MNLTAAALKVLIDKGLSLADVAAFVEANEHTRDHTAAERMRRMRAKRKGGAVTRNVTCNPPNDNTLTPSSEAKASSPKYPCPPGVDPETWDDFMASPKRKKAGMSRTAYVGICNNLNTLAEHGYPPGEMVALAVERGWTTVKLEWVKNDGRNTVARHQSADGLSSTARAAVAVFGIPHAGH